MKILMAILAPLLQVFRPAAAGNIAAWASVSGSRDNSTPTAWSGSSGRRRWLDLVGGYTPRVSFFGSSPGGGGQLWNATARALHLKTMARLFGSGRRSSVASIATVFTRVLDVGRERLAATSRMSRARLNRRSTFEISINHGFASAASG